MEVKILGTGSTTSSINWQNLQIWKPQMVQEEVLVDICEKDNDRYMFGFNGQEKVNEWAGIGNFNEYEFRGQDTRIGRFLSVDPLTQKYPYYTPYQFAGNKVISSIDIEGLEDVYYMDKKIEEVNGDVIIDLTSASSLFRDKLKEFQDPAFNKGFNIIIFENNPEVSMYGVLLR